MKKKKHDRVPTLLLVLTGLVIPNILFTGGALLGLAIEPRTVAIVLYCLVAILPLPAWARVILFTVVLAFDAISIAAGLFGFDFLTMLGNFRFALEIDAFSNRLYVVVICATAAVLIANVFLMTVKRDAIRRGNRIPLLAGCLALILYDGLSNSSATTRFWGEFKPDPVFSSGVIRSGFAGVAGNRRKPNVLFVMVESLGNFRNPKYLNLVFEPLRKPALLSRYTIATGNTPFRGSTTAAEMRELCETPNDFHEIYASANPQCLPDVFREAGYQTISVHGFKSSFFDRKSWYPRIGFERTIFREQLAEVSTDRRCGEVWRGFCDETIADEIRKTLRKAKRPTFLYWLTLNTHVPVGKLGTGELGCERPNAPVPDVEVCRMVELWRAVFAKVAAIAEQDDLEIFLVGDHRPPLLHRAARQMFSDETVPWVRMSPKPRKQDRSVSASSQRGG